MSEQVKKQADIFARNVEGVRIVNNQLTIIELPKATMESKEGTETNIESKPVQNIVQNQISTIT